MSNQDNSLTVVIKDFNVPAPNGNMYDLTDPSTLEAIRKFCERPHAMGEYGNPKFTGIIGQEEKIRRVSSIEIDKAVVEFTDMKFDAEKGTITGKVKPFGSLMPDLLEKFQNKEVTFGMRAFVGGPTDPDKKWPIHNIVTFDVVNPA